MQENTHSGIKIFGFVDEDPGRITDKLDREARILGDLSDIERLLKENVIDEIVVTLPIKTFYSEMEKILLISKKSGVEVKIPIDFFNTFNTKSEISNYLNHEVKT